MLDQILSAEGYPVAWVIAPDGSKRNIAFPSRKALIEAVPVLDQQNVAVYFSVGTVKEQNPPKVKKLIKGSEIWVPPLRAEANIHQFKSLWMDIDVDPDDNSKHPDTKTAVSALKQFLAVLNWPWPTIVSSGTGLHFYWSLREAIDVPTWKGYWPHLIAAAKHGGLKLDVAASNKATQVMRPPGTTHRKDPNFPKGVKVVHESKPSDFDTLFAKLKAYTDLHQLPLTQTGTARSTNTFATMMQAAGFTYTAPVQDRDAKQMLLRCAQMRRGLNEDLPEPVWRGVISTAALFPNGRKLAHILSKNDSRYDYDATEAKLDGLPTPPLPYTCNQFNDLTPGICDTCPNRGKVKSPIVLGDKVETVELTAPDPLPSPPTSEVATGLAGATRPVITSPDAAEVIEAEAGAYRTDVSGCWFTPGEDDATPVLLCPQRVWALKYLYRLNEDGNSERYYLFRIETAPGKHNDVLIAGDEAHSEHCYKQFTLYGVVIEKKANYQRFGNFMRAHLNKLAQTEPKEIFATLGWQPDGEFVTGVHCVPRDTQTQRATTSKEATDTANNNTMKPVGSYDVWREAMDVFNTPAQLHAQLCIGTAYAAPLFKFLGIDGLLLSLHGHSGIGKSAIQDAVASVWGDPASLMLKAPQTSIGDSLVSVMRHIGMMKSLPVLMEELSNLDPKFMSNFIHGLCTGKEKSRLRGAANGEYHRTKGLPWSTAFLSSSNESIADKLAEGKADHIAERYRVFELTNLQLLRTSSFLEDSRKLRSIKENYGHAGVIYMRYVQQNIDKVPTWIQTTIEQLTKESKALAEERFWIQGMAAWLVGLELAHYAGLHAFDIKKLRQYVLHQIEEQRRGIVNSKIVTETIFSEMINDMLPYALVVDQENELVQGMTAILPKRGSLHMRLELATGQGWVTAAEVKRWCTKHSIGLSALRDSGIRSGVLQPDAAQQTTLGRGVKELSGGGRVYAYEFRLSLESLTLMKEKIIANQEKEDDE